MNYNVIALYMGGSNSKPISFPRHNIPVGNWTQYVKDNKNIWSNEKNEWFLVRNKGKDPAPGCRKSFMTTYQCGNGTNTKIKKVSPEARGTWVRLDCNSEDRKCNGYRLTLRDDGNITYTNTQQIGKPLWESKTNKTGLSIPKYKASNGKYKRNFLQSGEFLSLGEFIGSPSGNCYLMMTQKGLQLCYEKNDCTMTSAEIGYGNSPNANALYSISKTNPSNINNVGYLSYGGVIKPFKESFSGGKSDVKTGKRFFDLGNFNVKGHNITRFANYDKDKCENECLYRNHCHGFFIHNDGTCYLKHSGMYPNNLRIASDAVSYTHLTLPTKA